MEAAAPSRRARNHSNRAPEAEGLIDYCSRPACRKEFRRTAGPGRRQEYCSEICRRTAEKELRQARSRLAHFEEVVEKLRIDVAAFGKPDLEEAGDDKMPPAPDGRRNAENAVRRAGGVLALADPNDPAVRELRTLFEAVAPVILSERMAG